MQYNIKLPSDYDMSIIRKRVQDSGGKTDGFQDLKMKAYLIAEKDKYSNYENQYAPFYLWDKTDGMNSFLLEGPFNNIINSFGRPTVNNWIVMYEYVTKTPKPQYVLIQTVTISEFKHVSALLESQKEIFAKQIANSLTTAYIIAYNPLTWEICYYHMSMDLNLLQELAQGSLIYDVHHIS